MKVLWAYGFSMIAVSGLGLVGCDQNGVATTAETTAASTEYYVQQGCVIYDSVVTNGDTTRYYEGQGVLRVNEHRNGHVVRSTAYLDGVLNGTSTEADTNGNLLRVVHYLNGKIDGSVVELLHEREGMVVSTYRKGELVGKDTLPLNAIDSTSNGTVRDNGH